MVEGHQLGGAAGEGAWAQVGDWFKAVSEVDDPAARLAECKLPLEEIAALEGEAWARLDEIVQAEGMAM